MKTALLIVTTLGALAGLVSKRPIGRIIASGVVIGYAIALWGMHFYYG